jgi:hypothetical protein
MDMAAMMKSQQDMLLKQQQQIELLTKMVQSSTRGASTDLPQQQNAQFRGHGGTGRRPYSGQYRGPGRTCYKCGSPDHFIRDCPDNRLEKRDDKSVPQNLN